MGTQEHWTAAQYQEYLRQRAKGGNKYHAVKAQADGRTYDSRSECKRQAYSYISAYEKLGQKYMADHADLGITKLELISQISSYEREEFAADVDLESATVRELKAEVERYKKQTEQLTFDLGQAQSELSEAPEPVDTDALRSSIEQEVKAKYSAQLEELQQRADAAPDPEAIRKEAEKEAAKEYKAKLATAKADAEKKAKATVEQLEQEKADLKRQLDSSATKLDAAVRQAKAAGADTDVAACRVYFTELQQTAAKVQELIGKINAKDPATGTKLSAAVISVLQSTAKKGQANDQERKGRRSPGGRRLPTGTVWLLPGGGQPLLVGVRSDQWHRLRIDRPGGVRAAQGRPGAAAGQTAGDRGRKPQGGAAGTADRL